MGGRGSGEAHLVKRSMLMKAYSPLMRLRSCAMSIMERTTSGIAHSTTTARTEHNTASHSVAYD